MSEVSCPEVLDEVMQKQEEMCEVQSKRRAMVIFESDSEGEKDQKKCRPGKRRAKDHGSARSEATYCTQQKLESMKARLKVVENKLKSMKAELKNVKQTVEKLVPGSLAP